jgi:hypothetical protein
MVVPMVWPSVFTLGAGAGGGGAWRSAGWSITGFAACFGSDWTGLAGWKTAGETLEMTAMGTSLLGGWDILPEAPKSFSMELHILF